MMNAMENHDHVDEVLTQWQSERPDLDTSPMGVTGRVSRLSRNLEMSLKSVFENHGINLGEFDVIATLKRSGKPYRLTPTQLLKSSMLTSGAMTNRLDQLEKTGLIAREADPNDRRSITVALTPVGLKLVDKAVEDHVANLHRVLSPLTDKEAATLSGLLRKLLLQFESDDDG